LHPVNTEQHHESKVDFIYRVVIVRVPKENLGILQAELPPGQHIRADRLPMVAQTVDNLNASTELADRLRLSGATVIVIKELSQPELTAFCLFHPANVAPKPCKLCGVAICLRCEVKSKGKKLCPKCHDTTKEKARNIRLRQLLVGLLFLVFVFEVIEYLKDDARNVDPFGVVKVAVMQFVSPKAARMNIVQQLNGQTSVETTSLHDIAPWYNQERTRYSGGAPNYMQVHIRGPWGAHLNPPALATPAESPFGMMYKSWKYANYFKMLGSDYGVKLNRFGVRIFVVYGNPDEDLASHSRGSKTGRIGITYISITEDNPAYATVSIAHEIAHALGAEDTYQPESSTPNHPIGFIEPFKTPLYPQRFAELMSVDLPVGPNVEKEVDSLDQVRVGYNTAAGMGWIDHSVADLFYSPPSDAPNSKFDQTPDQSEKDSAE